MNPWSQTPKYARLGILYLINYNGLVTLPLRQIAWEARYKVSYSITAWEINRAFYFDGFLPCIVEGIPRIGKTAYSSKAFTQAFGMHLGLKFNPTNQPKTTDDDGTTERPTTTKRRTTGETTTNG
jgi:hypothetical protein